MATLLLTDGGELVGGTPADNFLEVDFASYPIAAGDILLVHYFGVWPGGSDTTLTEHPSTTGNAPHSGEDHQGQGLSDNSDAVFAERYQGAGNTVFRWEWVDAYDYLIYTVAVVRDAGFYILDANTIEEVGPDAFESPSVPEAAGGSPVVLRGSTGHINIGGTPLPEDFTISPEDPDGNTVVETVVVEYQYHVTDTPGPDDGVIIAIARSTGAEMYMAITWPDSIAVYGVPAMSWTLACYDNRLGPTAGGSRWFTGVIGMIDEGGGG